MSISIDRQASARISWRVRALARREARHHHRQNVGARTLQQFHRADTDEQRLRRIESARDADHGRLALRELEPRRESLHLDVDDLAAARVARRGIGGYVREALVDAIEEQALLGRQVDVDLDRTKSRVRIALLLGALSERRLPRTLLCEAVEIDVRGDELRLRLKAPRFGEQRAVLEDHAIAVPREIGRRFAHARRAVRVGRETARRLIADELPAVFRLADDDVRRREVEQHGRAGHRRIRRRGNRHPQVLADLDVQDAKRLLREAEQQSAAERNVVLSQEVGAIEPRIAAGRELSQLVELAVVRRIGFRDQPEHAALRDDRSTIEQHPFESDR